MHILARSARHRDELPDFLDTERDRLRANVAISADSALWSHETPSLMRATRGSVSLQLDARRPNSDLYSGLHGGLAPNPLVGLATIIASMKSADPMPRMRLYRPPSRLAHLPVEPQRGSG